MVGCRGKMIATAEQLLGQIRASACENIGPLVELASKILARRDSVDVNANGTGPRGVLRNSRGVQSATMVPHSGTPRSDDRSG